MALEVAVVVGHRRQGRSRSNHRQIFAASNSFQRSPSPRGTFSKAHQNSLAHPMYDGEWRMTNELNPPSVIFHPPSVIYHPPVPSSRPANPTGISTIGQNSAESRGEGSPIP